MLSTVSEAYLKSRGSRERSSFGQLVGEQPLVGGGRIYGMGFLFDAPLLMPV